MIFDEQKLNQMVEDLVEAGEALEEYNFDVSYNCDIFGQDSFETSKDDAGEAVNEFVDELEDSMVYEMIVREGGTRLPDNFVNLVYTGEQNFVMNPIHEGMEDRARDIEYYLEEEGYTVERMG